MNTYRIIKLGGYYVVQEKLTYISFIKWWTYWATLLVPNSTDATQYSVLEDAENAIRHFNELSKTNNTVIREFYFENIKLKSPLNRKRTQKMDYKILKNERQGTGFRDSTLRCTKCDGINTRYLKIINYDVVTDRSLPTIICTTCLHNFIEEINASILKEVSNENTHRKN